MNITFRDIIWVGIIALILVVLSKCHRDKTNELNKDVSALLTEARMKDSIHKIESQLLAKKQAIINGQMQIAIASKLTAENKLEASMATAGRLSAELKRLKNWPVDTTALTVPQEYVDYCDSLAWTADSLNAEYVVFKLKNNYLLMTKDTAISLQRQLYDKERTARAECKRDFEALQGYYTQLDKRTKPANQVFIGAELLGSESVLFQNVGLALSLRTKTNKLLQVSGGLQNGGGWYGRINANILIRLRK